MLQKLASRVCELAECEKNLRRGVRDEGKRGSDEGEEGGYFVWGGEDSAGAGEDGGGGVEGAGLVGEVCG